MMFCDFGIQSLLTKLCTHNCVRRPWSPIVEFIFAAFSIFYMMHVLSPLPPPHTNYHCQMQSPPPLVSFPYETPKWPFLRPFLPPFKH